MKTIRDAFFRFYKSYSGGRQIEDPHQARDVELAFYSGYLDSLASLFEKGSDENVSEQEASQWLSDRCDEAEKKVHDILLEINKERMT